MIIIIMISMIIVINNNNNNNNNNIIITITIYFWERFLYQTSHINIGLQLCWVLN